MFRTLFQFFTNEIEHSKERAVGLSSINKTAAQFQATQTSKHTNKQATKQTNKQANTQTSKQTNKHKASAERFLSIQQKVFNGEQMQQ